MLRIVFPGMPDYGAVELKREYRRNFVRGLVIAAALHFVLLGWYWLHSWLTPEEKKTATRVVRVMTYNELPPPPSVTEDVGEAEFLSDQGNAPGRRRAGGGGNGTGAGTGGSRFSREALSREVSGKGILGMMTGVNVEPVAGGGSGIGEGLEGEVGELLSSLNGPGVRGEGPGPGGGAGGSGSGPDAGGQEVRGGRTGGMADINDVVTELGSMRLGSASRKGSLKIDRTSEVSGSAQRNTSRSPESLREVTLRHVPAVKYCYERSLRQNPSLQGKVVVRITVAPDGCVSDVSVVSSTLNDEKAEQCILSRIRQWKDFEPIASSEGSVTFKQTYAFGS
jgi:TonB family protein